MRRPRERGLSLGASSGSGLRHRDEATQPHAQKRFGLSSLRWPSEETPLKEEIIVSGDEIEKKREVTVTDIQMPFGSMVFFMVKWAVASIPALIIIVLLGTVFWGVTIGFLSSVGTTRWSSALANAITGKDQGTVLENTARQNTYTGKTLEIASPAGSVSVDANKRPAENAARVDAARLAGQEHAYISRVQVNAVHAGGPVVENAVFGEIKNNGNHRLLNVEMIVYCLDSGGKPIFQKKFQLFNENQHASLESGEIKAFGVSMNDAPLEWKHSKLDLKVTQVKFE